ncbi:MAG: aminotransferase class I/II-fold pyridoxal phosphate-dependent enzyme, partial [Oscillospiraceae bacterium]|nr:aminotransferase class I/II-fold pyridoxal phosphate-dependent enzyme [Oscillospiraceae bacterium]
AMLLGVDDDSPGWIDSRKYASGGSPAVKWLCPVPGYDRHFAICESLGIEMINVPFKDGDLDMDTVEDLVKDESVKGIWCVPMYANPTGITYSDDTVRRIARMKTGAADFRIFWDNAYAVHHLCDTPDRLLNVLDECTAAGNPDRVYMFASTSKITFPGSGVAVMAASDRNVAYIRKHMGYQSIGGDKLNQLRHVRFFGDFDGITRHMAAIRDVLKPKFDLVLDILDKQIKPYGLGTWHSPKGGYFISFDGNPGTASKTVRLCKEAGVTLTPAGAAFPYGKDPQDSNIRLAPSFPTLDELKEAMEVFCICTAIVNNE